MKMTWNLTILILASLLIAGCATTSGLEFIGKPNSENDRKHLVIHNESLANKITISSAQTRTTGDLLEVNLTVQNLTNRDRRVQYRFSWFDRDGFEVEAGSESWTPVVMHGASEFNIQALAPNTSIQSFKLNVREQ